jgi:very-short-patch-repair endonuclease
MVLSKRNPKTLTQFRFYIRLNELKLKKMGRIENIHRIANSELSWQSMIEWAKRISFYEGKRGETLEYYTIMHNDEKIAAEKMKKKSENISGDKNPWHNHGGKYSPWKKGSVNYSEEAVNKAKENATYNTTLIYYLKKGFGLCQSIKMLKERQAVGRLDKFISRYGEEEGLARWKARQEKWMKNFNKTNYSKISQILFDELYDALENKETIYYATLYREDMKKYTNKEYFFKTNKSIIRPDFICLERKKIIEFDGDYWHNKNLTANVKREKERDLSIIDMGYDVLHIKESDFRQNKEKVLQECVNFLNQ